MSVCAHCGQADEDGHVCDKLSADWPAEKVTEPQWVAPTPESAAVIWQRLAEKRAARILGLEECVRILEARIKHLEDERDLPRDV